MDTPQSSQSDHSNTPIAPKRPWLAVHRTLTFWVIILLIVLFIGLTHQKSASNKTKSSSATQVVLTKSYQSNVPVYITALGNVTPTYSVTVRTQINGQLMSVLYKEGQLVKTGDLLAIIDPRPYEAQLVQYEGQLKRDLALLANARVDLKRYQRLWKQDSISEQTLATQISLVEQYEGNVKTDQGLIEGTKVNLIYTRITSPIDGRVGLRLVDPGNFVQTTDTTGLMVINTLNPITVIFTIPEDNIPDVAKQIYDNQPLTVEAYDRDQNKLLSTGKLLTIDNQVDPTTGTVKLRAQFPNDDNRLFPSQFVNVKLYVKTISNATIVPTAAIQYSPKGPFVYQVNNDLTVMAKPIKVGTVAGDNTAIIAGLLAKQLVVIEGADKLTDGAKVDVAQHSQALLSPDVRAKLKDQTKKRTWRFFL
jgi:multidrug efflux system membrane fusion protein